MNKIILKGSYNGERTEEWVAAEAITPGHLVEKSADTVKKHSKAKKVDIPMFAIEDELQGKDIYDDYAANDRVFVWTPLSEDIVYAFAKANAGKIAIGDNLTSNGDGTLQKASSDEFGLVGQAVKAYTTSNEPQRIEVRIF